MLRRPKCSKIEVVAPEEEEDIIQRAVEGASSKAVSSQYPD
jgi:hypothetical protein